MDCYDFIEAFDLMTANYCTVHLSKALFNINIFQLELYLHWLQNRLADTSARDKQRRIKWNVFYCAIQFTEAPETIMIRFSFLLPRSLNFTLQKGLFFRPPVQLYADHLSKSCHWYTRKKFRSHVNLFSTLVMSYSISFVVIRTCVHVES